VLLVWPDTLSDPLVGLKVADLVRGEGPAVESRLYASRSSVDMGGMSRLRNQVADESPGPAVVEGMAGSMPTERSSPG
jgi:hypothetical protein